MGKRNKNTGYQVTHLSGTPKEQASQLLKIMKDSKLDVEQLRELLPNNIEVIKEFITCMKSDIDANQKAYARIIDLFEVSIKNLNEIIKDGKINDDEKKNCREEIVNIYKLMRDFHLEHERNLFGFWKEIAMGIFGLSAFIAYLTGRGKNNDSGFPPFLDNKHFL